MIKTLSGILKSHVGREATCSRKTWGGWLRGDYLPAPPVGPGTPLLRAAAEEIFALVQE